MTVLKEHLDWLDEDKYKSMKCDWFLMYMGRRNLTPTPSTTGGTSYEKCASIINDQSYPSGRKEFFSNLKKAWSSYKNKNKDGNKSYNFVMDATANDELNNLATGLKTTRNRTLELLIHDQYTKEVRAKLRREKLDKEKERDDKYSLASILRPLDYKDKIKELDTIKLQVDELQRDKETLERRVCELTVMLDSKDIISLDDIQKTKAEEMYQAMYNH
ncbi:MAG: hypothetical protein ACI9LM_002294 [Alteromonadaceae bacterium]|jgi:hypothetical protein